MDNESLNRTLKFKDVLILAFSTMIGWGWVSLTGRWSVQGGIIGASLAFLGGAVLCIFVGLTYSELTPMFPFAGGELVFSYKAMGYHVSWFTGWMTTFAYLGVAAWEGPALASAIDYLVPIPKFGYLYTIADFDVYVSWLILPAVVGMCLIFINYIGISFSSKFQTIITIILAMGGIFFAFLGIFMGKAENAQPLISSVDGVFSVVLAVPAMFVGFDVIPQAVEEMDVPIKKIPIAIIFSIGLAAVWYIMMIVSASLTAPQNVLKEDGLTVINAVNYSTGGEAAGKLIIISALMGILTSWNGFIIGATRIIYSMGRARMLPAIFGTLHSKYKTPYAATIFIGIITIFTPLLGKNSLGWFVDASAFGTVITYFMVALSFVILRKKCPDINRPFVVKSGNTVGRIAVLVSLFFIMLYLPIGPSSLSEIEWIIVLVWMILGGIFYGCSLKNKNKFQKLRERVLLGDYVNDSK
ncbi:MAG: APC family permease [Ruminococcus flavefaciens]|nr:APC family permease [Ruminococcus flavefaciens]